MGQCRRVAERETGEAMGGVEGFSCFLGLGFGEGGILEPRALAGDGDDSGMMEKTVEDGAGGGHVLHEQRRKWYHREGPAWRA